MFVIFELLNAVLLYKAFRSSSLVKNLILINIFEVSSGQSLVR